MLATSFVTSHTSPAFAFDMRCLILFSALQRHRAWDICLEMKWERQISVALTVHQGVTVFGFLLRSKNATQRTHGEGEPIPERRDEMMSEPGGHFEPGGCLTSLVDDHGTSWQEG